MLGERTPQLEAAFEPGDPASGYPNDLTQTTVEHASPADALEWLAAHTAQRASARPVSVLQLGIGAWQRTRANEREWMDVAAASADWARDAMDASGLIAHLFDMPHTFPLRAPWHSAMAQGEAVSLFVRLGDLDAAARAAQSLVDPKLGLIASEPEGPVLQEYPTATASHVLNGWIFALFGLVDLATTGSPFAADAGHAFEDGTRALAARLDRYRLRGGWSRYDLYPHPIAHAASPFYHRLHAELLAALDRIAPDPVFATTAAEWRASAAKPLTRALGTARKAGFRVVRPRGRSGR